MTSIWPMMPLSQACQIRPPKSEARLRLKPSDEVSFMPMEDLGICQKYVEPIKTRTLSEVEGSYTYFADGDVLLAKITPCFENGKLGIATGLVSGVGFGSSEFIVFRVGKHLIAEWLYYFLSQDKFRRDGEARMGGAVGHKRVSKEFIESYEIPVPPISEQKLLVGVLDDALAGISQAVTNAQLKLRYLASLEQSILHKAMNGSLHAVARSDQSRSAG